MTANDKITWWLRPQTPSEKSWIDFLRNDIRIIEVIWKSYHSMKNESKKKESWIALKKLYTNLIFSGEPRDVNIILSGKT